MTFSGNMNIDWHVGDVPDSEGTLTFKSSKDQNQGALIKNHFDHKATGTSPNFHRLFLGTLLVFFRNVTKIRPITSNIILLSTWIPNPNPKISKDILCASNTPTAQVIYWIWYVIFSFSDDDDDGYNLEKQASGYGQVHHPWSKSWLDSSHLHVRLQNTAQ